MALAASSVKGPRGVDFSHASATFAARSKQVWGGSWKPRAKVMGTK